MKVCRVDLENINIIENEEIFNVIQKQRGKGPGVRYGKNEVIVKSTKHCYLNEAEQRGYWLNSQPIKQAKPGDTIYIINSKNDDKRKVLIAKIVKIPYSIEIDENDWNT